jgi:hypothetical protein
MMFSAFASQSSFPSFTFKILTPRRAAGQGYENLQSATAGIEEREKFSFALST